MLSVKPVWCCTTLCMTHWLSSSLIMTLAAQVSCKILILNQKTIISELGIFFTFSFMPSQLCLVLYLLLLNTRMVSPSQHSRVARQPRSSRRSIVPHLLFFIQFSCGYTVSKSILQTNTDVTCISICFSYFLLIPCAYWNEADRCRAAFRSVRKMSWGEQRDSCSRSVLLTAACTKKSVLPLFFYR